MRGRSSTRLAPVARLTARVVPQKGESVNQPDSYEAPSVEEIDAGGYPISTAAGIVSGLD